MYGRQFEHPVDNELNPYAYKKKTHQAGYSLYTAPAKNLHNKAGAPQAEPQNRGHAEKNADRGNLNDKGREV